MKITILSNQWIRPTLAIVLALSISASAIFLINQLQRPGGASTELPDSKGEQSFNVTVIIPNGAEDWTGGSVHPIEWKIEDGNQIFHIQLHYSEDGGNNWIFIHEGDYMNNPNSSMYSWSIPYVDTNQALVRVCATDSDDTTKCDTSNSVFTIDSTKPTILSVDPAGGSTGVPIDKSLQTIFDESMNRLSVQTAFFIHPSVDMIQFHWNNDTSLTITHDLLQRDTTYTWGYSCQAKDDSNPGNPLEDCTRSFSFTTISGGDLGIDLTLASQDIHFSNDSPRDGETVHIFAHIHNIGTGDAYNVTVSFVDRISEMPPYFLIGYDTIPHIPPGSIGNASVDWIATPPGKHEIVVTADPYDTIPETNESNNVASRWIDVGNETGIDLTLSPSDIHFSDDNPNEGQTITIWAYIHNIGTEDANNVTVRFEDLKPSNVKVIIGYDVIASIEAGKIGNASITWNATPKGTHTIIVTADPFDTIPEIKEDNNEASRPIVVGSTSWKIFVHATMFDNDNDGKYDDVVILVEDSDGLAVEGVSIYIDSIFYGLTADTGLLILFNFSFGLHNVQAVYGSYQDTTTFYSEG